MKIDMIDTLVVGNPWKNWVLVRVTTDEGLVGWGDSTQGMATAPVVAAINEISRFYIGRDPRDIRAAWDGAYKSLFLPSNGTLLAAMAGIETACWDIFGKSVDLPLHRLLGGKVRDRVRAYANGWYNGPREVEFVAERATAVVEMGYTALKIDPFGTAHNVLTRDEYRTGMAILDAIRGAVGDDVDLIVELHDRLTVAEAVMVCRALEPIRPLWVEAPVWSDDVRATSAVANASPLRIGAGERFTHLRSFSDLLACDRIDLVLPEYIELGGISRLNDVAAIASSHQAMLAPHNARAMLSTAVNVHVGSTLDNLLIQETFDDFHIAWARELFDGLPRIEDGYLVVSDAPGLGIEVDEKLAQAHPYSDSHFLDFFQSGWEQRFDSGSVEEHGQ